MNANASGPANNQNMMNMMSGMMGMNPMAAQNMMNMMGGMNNNMANTSAMSTDGGSQSGQPARTGMNALNITELHWVRLAPSRAGSWLIVATVHVRRTYQAHVCQRRREHRTHGRDILRA